MKPPRFKRTRRRALDFEVNAFEIEPDDVVVAIERDKSGAFYAVVAKAADLELPTLDEAARNRLADALAKLLSEDES